MTKTVGDIYISRINNNLLYFTGNQMFTLFKRSMALAILQIEPYFFM